MEAWGRLVAVGGRVTWGVVEAWCRLVARWLHHHIPTGRPAARRPAVGGGGAAAAGRAGGGCGLGGEHREQHGGHRGAGRPQRGLTTTAVTPRPGHHHTGRTRGGHKERPLKEKLKCEDRQTPEER